MSKPNEDEFYIQRFESIQTRLNNNENVYPHKFFITNTVKSIINQFSYIPAEAKEDFEITAAGRVLSIRSFGKLTFMRLKDEQSTIQLVFSPHYINNKLTKLSDTFSGDVYARKDNNFANASSINHYQFDSENLNLAVKSIKRGDIVGFCGQPGRTKNNELSIFIHKISILSPCVRTLPAEHFGIKEPEMIYRKRYLDLLLNPESVARFKARSKIISFIRSYLDDLGFFEVETPMMNVIPGGAMAKPFVTHHNELKMDLFMRISPELYLKQLVIGGMNRVYELGKQYRNEGIDLTHNPEFTTCEFYMAYADYNDLMALTEDMLSKMVININHSFKVEYHPEKREQRPEKVILDFAKPFKRIDIVSELNTQIKNRMKHWQEDGSQYTTKKFISNYNLRSDSLNEDKDFLLFFLQKEKIKLGAPFTMPRILDKLIGEYIEPQCVNPTFLINHPLILSPLAKKHRDDPFLTERFELFINKKEICNAYTELNDPFDQLKRFQDQAIDAADGDEEAMMTDEAFVTALEYALPPTAGWGIGIDRLTMYLTNAANIRDVILFPAMRPEDTSATSEPLKK